MKKQFFIFILFSLALAGCSKKSVPAAKTAATPEPAIATKAIDPATTGSIFGVVSFSGAAPRRVPIDMTLDPACGFASKGPALSEDVVVNGGKLQNVFVYVKDDLSNYVIPVPAAPAVLDQIGCRYAPHVLGMMAGQKFEIQNSDRAMHNVHAMAQENVGWNESQMPGAQPLEHSFSAPELMIPITCNQHPWMKMYVNVVKNPFFAVSDADGKFTISGLPPGDYTLEAVQEKLGIKTAKVHVTAREAAIANFTFAPAR